MECEGEEWNEGVKKTKTAFERGFLTCHLLLDVFPLIAQNWLLLLNVYCMMAVRGRECAFAWWQVGGGALTAGSGDLEIVSFVLCHVQWAPWEVVEGRQCLWCWLRQLGVRWWLWGGERVGPAKEEGSMETVSWLQGGGAWACQDLFSDSDGHSQPLQSVLAGLLSSHHPSCHHLSLVQLVNISLKLHCQELDMIFGDGGWLKQNTVFLFFFFSWKFQGLSVSLWIMALVRTGGLAGLLLYLLCLEFGNLKFSLF